MKTLTKDNLSLYLLEDDVTVVMTKKDITVGDPPEFIIADCSSQDTVLHDGVSLPEEWTGHKYFYDGTGWALNPNFVKSND